MYQHYYGLRERPFDLTFDRKLLFLPDGLREALDTLRHGIAARRGIALLAGEAGTGKTTLVRSALHQPQALLRAAELSNPTLTRAEFFRFLAERLHLSADGSCKVRLLDALIESLVRYHDAGGVTVLAVDEAQSLPDELFEEIRLLANLEIPGTKLLQVLLIGQPELETRLAQPHLRQLKQRVALRCTTAPLTLTETGAFLSGRLRIAGGDPAAVFGADAVAAIHRYSRGIMRTICVIGENALVAGYAAERRPVTASIVEEVCRDLDIAAPAAHLSETAVWEASGGVDTKDDQVFPNGGALPEVELVGAAPALIGAQRKQRGFFLI